MRDAHLLGLAILAALAPACRKSASEGITTEPPTMGAPVATPPVPPVKDCAGATLEGDPSLHTVRYADGTAKTLHGMSSQAWTAATTRLLAECKALGPEALCDGELLDPADLVCRTTAHTPKGSDCVASLANRALYVPERPQGLAWAFDCGWVTLQVDPRSAEVLARMQVMEGRPLVGEHGAVLPPVCGTDDPVARHWLSMAAAERASVHSFKRNLFELQSLNAPQHLLDAVASAADDEAEHAALCVRLAGEGGLGPMPMSPAPRRGALAILRAVLVEACVNETIAALLVRRSAEASTDAERAAVLHRIADDEQRHAALAWRTLAWGLQTYPELFAALDAAIHEAIDRVEVRPADLVADGVLDETQTRQAVRDAVVPAWQACAARRAPRAGSHTSQAACGPL